MWYSRGAVFLPKTVLFIHLDYFWGFVGFTASACQFIWLGKFSSEFSIVSAGVVWSTWQLVFLCSVTGKIGTLRIFWYFH